MPGDDELTGEEPELGIAIADTNERKNLLRRRRQTSGKRTRRLSPAIAGLH
jgi:hypothetical protein